MLKKQWGSLKNPRKTRANFMYEMSTEREDVAKSLVIHLNTFLGFRFFKFSYIIYTFIKNLKFPPGGIIYFCSQKNFQNTSFDIVLSRKEGIN